MANQRWLLVTKPENYTAWIRSGVWGRKNAKEVQDYAPGDVFFMHVRQGHGILAMGMFTHAGEGNTAHYFDPTPLDLPAPEAEAHPWRVKFVVLGQLHIGIPTQEVLGPLKRRAPPGWFNGFVRQSHSLKPKEFDVLKEAFLRALRRELPPS